MGMVDFVFVVDDDSRFLGLDSFQSKDFNDGASGRYLYVYKGKLFERMGDCIKTEINHFRAKERRRAKGGWRT